MDVDWGQAFQVGVIGFALVFFVLTMLAISMWLVGWIFNKTDKVKIPVKTNKLSGAVNKKAKNKTETVPEYKPKIKIEDSDRYE
jgi:Na+-transporting methylmalonyl-CoA/oxaloacetate decarboxylase gamma subunit